MGVKEILIERATNQGREEARVKALAEKRQIAVNLKNKGIGLEIISEATGLTIEEIEVL